MTSLTLENWSFKSNELDWKGPQGWAGAREAFTATHELRQQNYEKPGLGERGPDSADSRIRGPGVIKEGCRDR